MTDLPVPKHWSNWTQAPLPGDASSRRFTRLFGPDGQTVMMMETPFEDADSQAAFTRIAKLLTDAGLAAPQILHEDGAVLILTDLGQRDMTQALAEQPNATEELYAACVDVLLRIQTLSPPKLTSLTPEVGGEMVRITADQYCNSTEMADTLAAAMTQAMGQLSLRPTTLALRDFHAENLIWRPDLTGTDRLGLLDFQDAFIAPTGYDLISLLRDARRDVSEPIYDMMVGRFGTAIGADMPIFRAQMACLAVQRNLRILGVFARLARVKGKMRYIPMLPRVWHHIQTDLRHPALNELSKVINNSVPAPDDAVARWGLT